MTLPYITFQKTQTQKQTYCLGEKKWTLKRTTEIYKCSKKNYKYEE